MVEFRQMTMADIPAGNRLCRIAGWNQVARDWTFFLDTTPGGSLVAVDENGLVIGTAATINYENRFAWIGMVLVDPARKREGIGTRLLQQALQLTRHVPCSRLDATPAGREVYLKLGFTDEYPLTRMLREPTPSLIDESGTAQPMGAHDFDEALKMDQEVFGASRSHLLHEVYASAPELAFVTRNAGGVSGYVFGRIGHQYIHAGPLIASNSADARSLMNAVLGQHGSLALICDISHFDSQWLSMLNSLGFAEQRPFTRMFIGKNLHQGHVRTQYAILGPEFG